MPKKNKSTPKPSMPKAATAPLPVHPMQAVMTAIDSLAGSLRIAQEAQNAINLSTHQRLLRLEKAAKRSRKKASKG
jgi:hypothetical protein